MGHFGGASKMRADRLLGRADEKNEVKQKGTQ